MPGRTRTPARAGAPIGAADVAGRLRDARLAALLRPASRSPRTARPDALDALIDRTAEVYSRALTDRTRLSYASRWRQFERWCGQHRFQSLPATAETVMMFLADAADGDAPLSLSTLRGRTAAINRVHLEAGHQAPGDDPAMAMLMRGLGRAVDRSPRADPISALRISDLREVLRAMQDVDPRLARDRALLALLEARITPEDMSRLRWDDVAVRGTGLRLRLRDRPSRPPSRSRQVAALADDAACPVAAVLAWRALAGEDPRSCSRSSTRRAAAMAVPSTRTTSGGSRPPGSTPSAPTEPPPPLARHCGSWPAPRAPSSGTGRYSSWASPVRSAATSSAV